MHSIPRFAKMRFSNVQQKPRKFQLGSGKAVPYREHRRVRIFLQKRGVQHGASGLRGRGLGNFFGGGRQYRKTRNRKRKTTHRKKNAKKNAEIEKQNQNTEIEKQKQNTQIEKQKQNTQTEKQNKKINPRQEKQEAEREKQQHTKKNNEEKNK